MQKTTISEQDSGTKANLTTVYVAELTAVREKVMYVDAAIHAALN